MHCGCPCLGHCLSGGANSTLEDTRRLEPMQYGSIRQSKVARLHQLHPSALHPSCYHQVCWIDWQTTILPLLSSKAARLPCYKMLLQQIPLRVYGAPCWAPDTWFGFRGDHGQPPFSGCQSPSWRCQATQ